MVHRLLDFILAHLELFFLGAMILVALWRAQVKNQRQAYAKKILDKAIKMDLAEPLSLHPEIDPIKCAGCGACTTVCPEGDILKMINHKAVLVGPSKCVGHGECQRACPMNAITLVFGTKRRGVDIPNLTTNYETNVPGLYIAGELGGMGLIRNAVKQGVLATTHACKNLPKITPERLDIFIIGAGPAGLSSALVAITQKRKYMLIEQNSFGGTVYNFPRQKIVMTHPAQLPIFGEVKFPQNKVTKEELLGFWNKVRVKAGIKISEKTKFQGLQNKGDHFLISTDKGEFEASKVILAMGVRGTPRRLGLPNEDLPKVTYNLLDATEYRQKRICVVGGGNAGVEAAMALADPKLGNEVKLLVRGPTFDRCNDDNRTRVEDMARKKQLDLWFNSSVNQIETSTLEVIKEKSGVTVPNDFLFVFAGAELPSKMLQEMGIKIDKKFGEALKSVS